MAARKTRFLEGESYHIYNRGNSKQQIFHDEQDYARFKKILYLCNGTKRFKFKDLIKYEKNPYGFEKGESIVSIYAYVLMPNHFHLFLTPNYAEGTDKNLDNSVSIFLKRIGAAYTMYYNRKYNRTGSLFEGTFKAEHVSNDNYFKYLFSYIHLNPIKIIQKDWKEIGINNFQEAKKFLENYKHSSFGDYFTSPGEAGGIINKQSFLSKLPADTDLNKEIFDWLKFRTIN